MPDQMTSRDVVPILEDLRQLTKVPLVAKQDTILYKRIAEASNRLCSIDIENATIESHASKFELTPSCVKAKEKAATIRFVTA